jgi:hypothetical protein
MKRRSRALTLISLLIGLALFVYVVKQAGLSEILARVRALGAGLALIIAISSIRQAARGLAWLRCMTVDERRVGFFAVLRARLAGDAIGDLTTAGPLIAEPLKVMALGGKLPMAAGASSLAVENLAYIVSSCVMVFAGTLSLLAAFALSESLRAASLIALTAVLAVIIASFIIVNRRWAVLSGLAAVAARAIERIRSTKRAEAQTSRVRELENYVFDFYARRPVDFFLVALCEIGFHLAGIAEIYVTLRLIGAQATLAAAFILEAVNRVINIAFAFVPAMVGVDEAGTGLLAQTLGLGAAIGVTLAIVRKIRMFFWIGLGLIFLAGNQPPQDTERTERELKMEDRR